VCGVVQFMGTSNSMDNLGWGWIGNCLIGLAIVMNNYKNWGSKFIRG
jgi:hypothetical protein